MRHERGPTKRERLLLALLLAFLIDTVRTPFALVDHAHPGDARPHTHVGEPLGAQRVRPAPATLGTDAGRYVIAAATDLGLHSHLTERRHHLQLPTLTVPQRTLWSVELPAALAPALPAGVTIAGHARAPPRVASV